MNGSHDRYDPLVTPAAEPAAETTEQEMLELLALAADPVQPPSGIRARVLQYARGQQAPPAGVTVIRASADWQPHEVPRSSFKILTTDRTTGAVTMVLRLEPGAEFPAHEHRGPEECYVVDGSFFIGDRFYQQGDFIHAEPGTADEKIYSPSGTTVILVVSAADAASA